MGEDAVMWMMCGLVAKCLRSLAVTVMWAFLLFAFHVSHASEIMVEKTNGCEVYAPSEWLGGSMQWSGRCFNNMANGLGVLRYFKHGTFVAAFYGLISDGRWCLGVLDDGRGYVAGQFSKADVVPTDDRNLIIVAFDIASQAAFAFSEKLQEEGNIPSAKHYARVAKQLGSQMD